MMRRTSFPLPFTLVPASAAVALALSVASCTSTTTDPVDIDQAPPPTPGTPGDPGTPVAPAPPTPAGPPVHAIATQTFSPEGQTSYIVLAPTLAAGDYGTEGAIELPGRAVAVGLPGTGSVFTATSEGPVVTRWSLGDDGKLAKTGEVSFAAFGITSLVAFAGQFPFVSDEKAYYFDDQAPQVIVWNPKTMTVTKSLALPSGAVEPGYTLTFETSPRRRGDEIIASLSWLDQQGQRALPRTGLVFVDTKTDAVTFTSREGCGYVLHSAPVPNGDIYYSAGASSAVWKKIGGPSASPGGCLVRLPAGTKQLDPTFQLDLDALAGGAAGSVLPTGSDKLVVRALVPGLAPENPTKSSDLIGPSVWNWATLDVAAPSVTPTGDRPPGYLASLTMEVDGTSYVLETGAGFATSTFVELGKGGELTPRARIRGVAFGTVRLR